jgi:hypothetical protein
MQVSKEVASLIDLLITELREQVNAGEEDGRVALYALLDLMRKVKVSDELVRQLPQQH